eukprot:2233057-Amphidinium_carterae.1
MPADAGERWCIRNLSPPGKNQMVRAGGSKEIANAIDASNVGDQAIADQLRSITGGTARPILTSVSLVEILCLLQMHCNLQLKLRNTSAYN